MRFAECFEVILDPALLPFEWLQRRQASPAALGQLLKVGKLFLPTSGASSADVEAFYEAEFDAQVALRLLAPGPVGIKSLCDLMCKGMSPIVTLGQRISDLATKFIMEKTFTQSSFEKTFGEEEPTNPGVGPHVIQIETSKPATVRTLRRCYYCGHDKDHGRCNPCFFPDLG